MRNWGCVLSVQRTSLEGASWCEESTCLRLHACFAYVFTTAPPISFYTIFTRSKSCNFSRTIRDKPYFVWKAKLIYIGGTSVKNSLPTELPSLPLPLAEARSFIFVWIKLFLSASLCPTFFGDWFKILAIAVIATRFSVSCIYCRIFSILRRFTASSERSHSAAMDSAEVSTVDPRIKVVCRVNLPEV